MDKTENSEHIYHFYLLILGPEDLKFLSLAAYTLVFAVSVSPADDEFLSLAFLPKELDENFLKIG